MPAPAGPPPGPLSGVVVVDLSRALAGPHAAMMLGDLGARVIKVEAPGTGDDTRGWGPPFVGPEDARESTYFLSCNRNKESIALDLKSDDGRATLTRLVRHADVLVENFRTGVLDRLGFSTERLHELNPRLVVLSITGFGHDGPEGGRAGYDQIAQGEAGLMSLTGPDPGSPTRTGVPIGDLLAGMYGAYGVAAALTERERTGRGTVVRTSLLAAIVGVHAFQGTRHTVAGQVPRAQGNHHPSLSPYGAFRCRDAIVQVAVASEGLWRKFAPLVGIAADDPRFATNAARHADRDALKVELQDALRGGTVEHWLAELDLAGVPCGPISSVAEAVGSPQAAVRNMVVDAGGLPVPGNPVKASAWDDPAERPAAPALDEHGALVRAEFGP